MLKRLTQTGDTIVEVLLAIAIVSAVLGGAYASTSGSLSGSRRSQERGEAVKLLQGQLERLNEAAHSPTVNLLTAPNPFCLIVSGGVLTPVAATNPGCQQGVGSRYRLSIQRAGNVYTATAQWDRVGGGGTSGQDQVVMIYRIYEQ